MTKTKTVLLIDGDVFVYQIGLAAEKPTNWGDDLWTLHADFAECRTTLNEKVETLRQALGADSVIFALSCPTQEGFRRGICETYKANRKDVRKPVVHQPLRQYLLEEHDTILRPRLEADDILGVMATRPTKENRIIVSVDKDFRGVPCNFYRMTGDNPSVVTITVEEATRFHALQTLMGDRVDGYVGIPGCGEKTAEKFLDGIPTKDLWPTIVAAYAKAGLGEELALTNARLARILQHKDYDSLTGTIKLWTPSQPASQVINSSAPVKSKKVTS